MRILEVGPCDFLTQIPDISGLLNLEEFSLECCNNLIRIDDSVGLLDKLRTLTIYKCEKLKSIPPLKLPSLKELSISSCFDFVSFQPIDYCSKLLPSLDGLLGSLKFMKISKCNKIRSIPFNLNLPSLEELHFEQCVGLDSFPIVVDGSLSKLKKLSFICCDNLKSFPPLQLPSLESLILLDCPSLENFPSLDGLLGSLKFMKISNCNKIRSIPPLKLTLLEEFELYKCNGLEGFPLVLDVLMGNLKILRVKNCSNIKSFSPLKLPLLEKLHLSYCDSLECFPTLKLPSLEELYLSNCGSLESFSSVEDGLLGKLKFLFVDNCKNLKSIPPLKLPLLEELTLSHCDSLESFPLVVDGSLDKLKNLTVESCRNLKSFLPLKLASLEHLNLSDCGSLESFLPLVDRWMDKLEVLKVVFCRNHRSIPPIKSAYLDELVLSCDCCCRYTIHEIEEPHWDDTFLKELPFSLQDLTCLKTLYLRNCGIVQFPISSIAAMSELTMLTITYGRCIFPNQDEGEEKVVPMQYSRGFLTLKNCKISDESLAIGLKWFANVIELDLSCSIFTTLPECIKNCHFLWKLVMDDCEKLQEIKGIPPNIKTVSAFNCSSLTSSCTSKLLNQEVHKFGNTNFILPGVDIPNWFDSESMQRLSVSFWFRNEFPAIALCAVSPIMTWNDSKACLKVTINGIKDSYKDDIHLGHYVPKVYHLWIFHMQYQRFNADPYRELLENKWNHAVIEFEFGIFKSGITFLKEISRMEDIRFDNPEIDLSLTL